MQQSDSMKFLLNRHSCGLLKDPAPSHQQLELMVRAASRAADHACLQPWRFIVLQGEQRQLLADAMLKSALAENPQLENTQQQKILKKPFRAPMVIIAISKNLEHPKVPIWEQQLATAAAVQNMLNAAYILELGAYWRTGTAAFSEIVKQGLKIKQQESIVGFIYLGLPQIKMPAISANDDWKKSIEFGIK